MLPRAGESLAGPSSRMQASPYDGQTLRRRLEDAGLAVVSNAGGGDADLCLLSALLQASGEPAAQVDEQARTLRDRLAARPDDLGRALREGQGLHADPAVMQAVMADMFPQRPAPPLLVMTAGAQGSPLLSNPLWERHRGDVNPATVPHDTAVILESAGRFEWVANASGQPWSAVLQRLERAALDPAVSSPIAQDIEVAVGNGFRGQADRSFSLRLGLQASMASERLNPDALPMDEAGAFARAQGTVTEVVKSLKRWRALEAGPVAEDSEGVAVHRLAVPSFPPPGQAPAEPPSVFQVAMEVRSGWVAGMEIEGRDMDAIAVRFDHPDAPPAKRARTLPPQQRQWLHEASQARTRRAGREAAISIARNLAELRPGLSDEALAQGSGAAVNHIEKDSNIHPVTLTEREKADLSAAIASVGPRERGSGVAYARRLHAFDARLSDVALSVAGKLSLQAIRRDPAIHPHPIQVDQQAWLSAALSNVPREEGETDVAFARRLAKHDGRLTDEALANGSGARLKNVKADSIIHPPALTQQDQALLASVAQAVPRGRLTRVAHARQIHARFPALELRLLAMASGVNMSVLAGDPAIVPVDLPAGQKSRADEVISTCARKPKESDIAYARRVSASGQDLSLEALAYASGARLIYLQRDPVINPPKLDGAQQARLDAAVAAVGPRGEEARIRYASRLKAFDPGLSLRALSRGAGIDGKVAKTL